MVFYVKSEQSLQYVVPLHVYYNGFLLCCCMHFACYNFRCMIY